jgi:hypothetical protein
LLISFSKARLTKFVFLALNIYLHGIKAKTMKLTIFTIFTFILGLSSVKAQQNNTQTPSKKNAVVAPSKAEQDSLERDKKNGTIYTKVNKDGVIEIFKKDFEKIPAERQEIIRKDKNYKIVESK